MNLQETLLVSHDYQFQFSPSTLGPAVATGAGFPENAKKQDVIPQSQHMRY